MNIKVLRDIFILFLIIGTFAGFSNDPNVEAYKLYAKENADFAIEEMRVFGIPASITLAQAMLESSAGRSLLARKSYNHFGMKCHAQNCPKGHCINLRDDRPNDYFLNFENVQSSYRSHSLFLRKMRYAHLFLLKSNDYKAWAAGLQDASYASDKNYQQKLIRIIELYELHKYDELIVPVEPVPFKQAIFLNF